MSELSKTLESLLSTYTINEFIDKLIQSHYSFALWRTPEQKTLQLIIDLDLEETHRFNNLEELDSCFIINSFQDNHPPKPSILYSDIIIDVTEEQPDTSFSPKVSSSHIENFIETINKGNIEKSIQHQIAPGIPDFKELVEKAKNEIKSSEVSKIVISRFEDFQLPDHFHVFDYFKKLVSTYPRAFCYLISTSSHGVWVGASPERLISIENQVFRTESLAGTQLAPEDGDLGNVAWTQKEIEEQAMVSRYIIDCLKKIRLREFEESGPKTVQAGQLAHLKTEYKVNMSETNTPDLGTIMLELLHPTSAVCGMPYQKALDFILTNEGYNRELFAGFLGPVNFNKKTELFVNLRCMRILDQSARLFAGAGITEDSHPEKELKETIHKMNTLLNVF